MERSGVMELPACFPAIYTDILGAQVNDIGPSWSPFSSYSTIENRAAGAGGGRAGEAVCINHVY